VSRIRQQDIDYIWTIPGTPPNGAGEIFAGQMFHLARPIIQCTKLWKIIQRIPKGALLHAHFGALVPFDISFETMLKTPGMHISSPVNLASAFNRDMSPIKFSYVKSTTQLEETGSIWTIDYTPNVPVPLTVAANSYPLGGRAEFLKYLKSTVTLSAEELPRHDLGVDAIWRKFEKIFSILGSVYSYEPLFRSYLQQLFNALMDDSISWVELRQTFTIAHVTRKGCETPEMTPDYVLNIITEEVKKFQATSKGQNFLGLRTIWCGLRAWDRDNVLTGN
jgi:adenosine deaminase CECR1